MSLKQQQWLQEMGINQWMVQSPERFVQAPLLSQPFSIEEDCKLLLVTATHIDLPKVEFELFTKIIALLHLDITQVKQIPIEALSFIKKHQLEWCWFYDIPIQTLPFISDKEPALLTSASFKVIYSNPLAKKRLWSQIKQQLQLKQS